MRRTADWTTHAPGWRVGRYTSLAAAKRAVVRRGISTRIDDYEGRPLMLWCPIKGWKDVSQ